MKLPIFPTLIVAAACGVMIWLGLWQLDRRTQKLAQIALYEANFGKPEMAFPEMGPVRDEAMFRKGSGLCLAVKGWRSEAGKAVNGRSGYRWLAQCGSGAEGPGMLVDMGVSNNPSKAPDWKGGAVAGRITAEPNHASLFTKMLGKAPPLAPLLVSASPAPGLVASAPPRMEDVPNPHLGYAIQWFIFAATAFIIYILALRRRAQTGERP